MMGQQIFFCSLRKTFGRVSDTSKKLIILCSPRFDSGLDPFRRARRGKSGGEVRSGTGRSLRNREETVLPPLSQGPVLPAPKAPEVATTQSCRWRAFAGARAPARRQTGE